jgi:hypothetical protein
MKTVAAVFSSMAQMERVVRDLERIGVPNEAISMIAGNEADRHKEYLEKAQHASRSAGAAAASGASFGGGVGIVASLVVLAIPGAGPIIAGGAIAAVLTGLGVGAAGGGLISALHNMAIPHEDAALYQEALRRGALIVVAEVDDPMESEVVDLMAANGGREVREVVDPSDPHPHVSDSAIRWHDEPAE